MKIRGIELALLTATLLSCSTTHMGSRNPASATEYSGQSDYRLIFADQSGGTDFSPTQDILKLSPQQVAQEEIMRAFQSTALRSLLPLMGTLTGNKTGTEAELIQSLMITLSSAAVTVKQNVADVERDYIERMKAQGQTPVSFKEVAAVQDVFLVPWDAPRKDLFYGHEKLSSDPGKAYVYQVAPRGEEFWTKLTSTIKQTQAKLYRSSPDPIFLLGFRLFFFYNPAAGVNNMVLKALIGMKPQEMPFVQKSDKVDIDAVVVPDVPGRGSVVVANFNFPLNAQSQPTLTLDFGDFDKYENGDFKVLPTNRQSTAVRFKAHVAKAGLRKVAVNFAFERMEFNLAKINLGDGKVDAGKVEMTKLNTVTSAGLRIGKSNFTLGGFHIQMVDKEFKGEINKSIEAEMNKVLDSDVAKAAKAGAEVLENGYMSQATIQQGFALLFDRK